MEGGVGSMDYLQRLSLTRIDCVLGSCARLRNRLADPSSDIDVESYLRSGDHDFSADRPSLSPHAGEYVAVLLSGRGFLPVRSIADVKPVLMEKRRPSQAADPVLLMGLDVKCFWEKLRRRNGWVKRRSLPATG